MSDIYTAKTQLYAMKGMLTDLPQAQRDHIESLTEQVRALVATHGDDAVVAMTMVTLELATKPDPSKLRV